MVFTGARRSSASPSGAILYLKVCDASQGDCHARGMAPFRPNGRQALKPCDAVSPDVPADREALHSWAGEAVRARQESPRP